MPFILELTVNTQNLWQVNPNRFAGLMARENGGGGGQRNIEGIDWDKLIPFKLFLVLDGNTSLPLFPQTSAKYTFHLLIREFLKGGLCENLFCQQKCAKEK